MAITENWNIRSRAHVCAATSRAFADGETFVTVLLEEKKSGELVRRDYSLEAWDAVEPTLAGVMFSFWKSTYEVVRTEAKPEIAEKESAEALLRRLCEEDSILTENTRYILAVMLERKKQLKQTGTRETEEATFLVYEQAKSGEVYIIRDPELRLDQIEEVQKEVSRLLSGGGEAEPSTAAVPEDRMEAEGKPSAPGDGAGEESASAEAGAETDPDRPPENGAVPA